MVRLFSSASDLTPSRLLDPLLVLLLALGFALLLMSRKAAGQRRRRRRFPLILGWIAWTIHWILATPRFSFWALGFIEAPQVHTADLLTEAEAETAVMVVLTGGSMTPRPESTRWRPETLAGSSLPRAVGAARVYRERPVRKVIVTGRAETWENPDDTAAGMADVMVAFGVPKDRIVIEPLARDTRQNAFLAGFLAMALGAKKVIVVTSALHMPRAVQEFERIGIHPIAAPVDHRYESQDGIASLLPAVASFQLTGQVIHEVLGHFKP